MNKNEITESQQELVNLIRRLNAKLQAWLDENPDLPVEARESLYVEDPAHWAGYDVYSVEDFERYQLNAFIWDLYKKIYGKRPRHLDLQNMSIEELHHLFDRLRTIDLVS